MIEVAQVETTREPCPLADRPLAVMDCRLLRLLRDVERADPTSAAHHALVIETISQALQCGFDAGFYVRPEHPDMINAVVEMSGGVLLWMIPAFPIGEKP